MGLPQNGWFIRENPTKMDDDWGFVSLGLSWISWEGPELGVWSIPWEVWCSNPCQRIALRKSPGKKRRWLLTQVYPLVNEHNYWKLPFLMGKSTSNGPFSIATMLVYQRLVQLVQLHWRPGTFPLQVQHRLHRRSLKPEKVGSWRCPFHLGTPKPSKSWMTIWGFLKWGYPPNHPF